MSAPATIHTLIYFVQRDDSTCARETKPSFTTDIGQVESCEFQNDQGIEIFQKWNSSSARFEDHTVFPVQEVQTASFTCRELSAVFWQHLRRALYAINGSYVPGRASGGTILFPGEGWCRFEHKDHRALLIDRLDLYGYLQVERHSFARGIQSVPFTFRKLYSTQNGGTWSNVQ